MAKAAAAAKSPQSVCDRATEVLTKHRADARTVLEAAEEILMRTSTLDVLRAEDAAILASVGYTDRRLSEERLRIIQVRSAQQKAGSAAAYSQATSDALAAQEAEEQQAPKLREQLAQIEVKLEELTERRAATAAALKTMDDAREQLRKYDHLPRFIRDEYDARTPDRNALHKQLLDAENRLGRAESDTEVVEAKQTIARAEKRLKELFAAAEEVLDYYVRQL